MEKNKPLRFALVHDYLIRYGGAERVLAALHAIFPQAPIYTLFADPQMIRERFDNADIRTSGLQRLPYFLKKRYRYLAPLLIAAVEQFDLGDFDIVISSSSSFCKGVITKPNTIHIDYCHTPTRFLWDCTHAYAQDSFFGFGRCIRRALLHFLRIWDFEAAQRPDYLIANSRNVQERIKKFYRRESSMIYPPVSVNGGHEVECSKCSLCPAKLDASPVFQNGEYFLVVSYLQTYKNIDIAVEAFSKLDLPLVIIGEGPEKKRLRALAGPSVKFLGWQSDASVQHYLENCKAFVFPTDEDFGIAPVEAMLHGKPVLALRRGGALETVEEGVSGEFFDDSHPAVLADCIRRFLEARATYNPDVIRKGAERFTHARFAQELRLYLRTILAKHFEVI